MLRSPEPWCVAVLVSRLAHSYAVPAVGGRIANLGVFVHHDRRITSLVVLVSAVAAVALECVVLAAPAVAGSRPTVTALSRHRGPYWGATRVVVRGSNLGDVRKVMFGANTGYALHVVSSTKLAVIDPEHGYGTVHVRVVGPAGASLRTVRDRFTYTRPTMNTPIMGGLTARQEQRISARVRAAHHGVRIAARRKRWTPAMGATAARRARSWLGLPYSWAGGNGAGPTPGVCAHNGGDLDCHVVGFDCSGLTLYAWSPYMQLIHYAASQHSEAGRFHPTKAQLVPGDLVFFSGYIADGIGHVAVYVGHGMVIQAAQSGTRVMRSRLVDVIAESGVYRGATRPMSHGRQGPSPRVSALGSHKIPAAGGYVRITGRHLASTTSVSIGGRTIYSFASRSATYLKVRVPAHRPGPVMLSVSNAWGTVHRNLAYVGAPTISSLSPASGPTAGHTEVTIGGTGLTAALRVELGGRTVAFRRAASNHLTFKTPAHAAGSVPVTVTSRFGTSNAVPYTFGAPATNSARHGPYRTEPRPSRIARTARGSTPGAGTPGGARRDAQRTSTGSSGDRIGVYWYLVGRLSVERYSRGVRGCAEASSGRFTDCLARAVLFDR
jgi:cell wall-associated NlpC family hydrolase